MQAVLGVIRGGSLLAVLGVNSYTDIRYRSVLVWTTWILLAEGVALRVIEESIWSIDTILALVPGMLAFLPAILFREDWGMGDSWMLLAIGSIYWVETWLQIFTIAILLAAVWAVILLVFLHKGRKDTIPFIPFLFMGCLISILI